MSAPAPLFRMPRFSRGTTIAVSAIVGGFLMLIASALLIGGHTSVTATLPTAKQVRPAETIGTAAYPLADGKTCRELVFDRSSSEIIESKTRRCREPHFGADNWSDLLPMPPPVTPGRASNGFRWGKS